MGRPACKRPVSITSADQRCDEGGQAGRGYVGFAEWAGPSGLPGQLVQVPGGVATRTAQRGISQVPAADRVRRVRVGDFEETVDVLDVTGLQARAIRQGLDNQRVLDGRGPRGEVKPCSVKQPGTDID